MSGEEFPTAHLVAVAIVAACRETEADPMDVAKGVTGDKAVSRARLYAAMAIDELYDIGSTAASRMCGVRGAAAQGTFLATHRWSIKKGNLAWFRRAAVDRVVTAVRGARRVDASTPAPASAPTQEFACEDCGGPCSQYARKCRDCYRGLTRGPRRTAPAVHLLSPGQPPASSDNKSELHRMLAQAAANTAKMQPKGDGDNV